MWISVQHMSRLGSFVVPRRVWERIEMLPDKRIKYVVKYIINLTTINVPAVPWPLSVKLTCESKKGASTSILNRRWIVLVYHIQYTVTMEIQSGHEDACWESSKIIINQISWILYNLKIFIWQIVAWCQIECTLDRAVGLGGRYLNNGYFALGHWPINFPSLAPPPFIDLPENDG